MPDLKETVLVTGASSGIGYAISNHLLKKDFSVIGVSRSSDVAIRHPDFHAVSLDLANLRQLPQQLENLQKKFPQISHLVLCAGQGLFGSLEEFAYPQIEQLININFTSQAFVARSFIPGFKAQKKGTLIFMGSEAAQRGTRKGTLYCASKFALRGFTQALRDECGKSGVRISLINPGMTRTPFFDKLSFEPGPEPHQSIEADDIAELVEQILTMRAGTVIDEINLSPLTYVVKPKK